VDPSSPETVAVAILGTPSLDPDSVDLQSLHLAGAAAVKNAVGATHAVEDVNGDGRPDLIVWFSTRALQITDADVFGVLVGTTRGGIPIEGRDAIRTLAAELRADAEPRAGAAEAAGAAASTGPQEQP